MSLLVDMEVDRLRRSQPRFGESAKKHYVKRPKRYAPVDRNFKPAQPRSILGVGTQFKSSFEPLVAGESKARLQSGITSKAKIIGGGRFDYNRPTFGYFYGEK